MEKSQIFQFNRKTSNKKFIHSEEEIAFKWMENFYPYEIRDQFKYQNRIYMSNLYTNPL